jgi:hypothetical protein
MWAWITWARTEGTGQPFVTRVRRAAGGLVRTARSLSRTFFRYWTNTPPKPLMANENQERLYARSSTTSLPVRECGRALARRRRPGARCQSAPRARKHEPVSCGFGPSSRRELRGRLFSDRTDGCHPVGLERVNHPADFAPVRGSWPLEPRQGRINAAARPVQGRSRTGVVQAVDGPSFGLGPGELAEHPEGRPAQVPERGCLNQKAPEVWPSSQTRRTFGTPLCRYALMRTRFSAAAEMKQQRVSMAAY